MNPCPQQHPVYLHLHKNFQQTKTHLSITNLDNPLISRNPQILPIFLQRTAKKHQAIPKKLKRLTLDLHNAQFQASLLFNLLLKDLQHLQHLEHLKIILSPDRDLPAYFQVLLKTLQKSRNLRVFEITVSIYFEWNHQHYIKSLIETLSRSAPKLKDFKLIFREGNGSTLPLTGEPRLNGWGIEKLAYLQNLTLHLTRSAFLTFPNENEAKFDISALRTLTRLKSLDLGIVDANIERLPNLKKFTFNHPKRKLFPNLKRFRWTLLKSRWNEVEGLQVLGCDLAVSFRNSLEDFSLKLKQLRPIKDHEIKMWNQNLASLKTDLNQLHISCDGGELTSKDSKGLISALSGPKLKRMRILYLEFLDWKGINDRFMAKLGQVINQNMNGLRYLRVRFEFNQATLFGLAGTLQNIFGDKGLTDKGISRFGASLAGNGKNLEFVWLEFGKYEKISDRGVESLCESLSQIESLKRAWLRFRFCFGVTGRSGEFAWKTLGPSREVKFALI